MFKNLKSLFIIEEEDSSKKPTAKDKDDGSGKKVKQDSPSPNPAKKANTHTSQAPTGQVRTKFTDILLRAMEQQNLDGFDYLEYKQSLRSLEKMPMDEKTRFQSAFAMAQTMGASPEKLIQTAQHYLDVLRNEENKFEKALASQRQKQIGSKEGQIAKLGEVIREKNEKIKELTQEIKQHEQEMTNLKDEIGDAVVKVETTKNDFIASYEALAKQIANDMENMKNFLK